MAELQPDITYAEYLASSRQQWQFPQADTSNFYPWQEEHLGSDISAIIRALETFRAWQQLAAWADSLKGNQ